MSVLSRQTTEYSWRLRARRRGHFRGVLAFVAKPNDIPLAGKREVLREREVPREREVLREREVPREREVLRE